MVFKKQYASFYDRFYREKNYTAECDLVEKVFRSAGVKPQSVLDLGCGTGSHSTILAQRGYKVTGVDQSAFMLETAGKKAGELGLDITFKQQDISRLQLDAPVDAALSMFAVIGYLTDNNLLESTFLKIREHLTPGGIFIFDCWYGPAVMSGKPECRVHTYTLDNGRQLIRIVTPELDALNHVVKVSYRVLELQGDKVLADSSETHPMRFLFPQEIRYFLEKAGFTDIRLYPFDSLERTLEINDWNMLVTARRAD